MREVLGAMAEHGDLRCTPEVEMNDGKLSVTLTVRAGDQIRSEDAVSVVELFHRLREVHDLAQVRGLAARYGVPPERLEAVLQGRNDVS